MRPAIPLVLLLRALGLTHDRDISAAILLGVPQDAYHTHTFAPDQAGVVRGKPVSSGLGTALDTVFKQILDFRRLFKQLTYRSVNTYDLTDKDPAVVQQCAIQMLACHLTFLETHRTTPGDRTRKKAQLATKVLLWIEESILPLLKPSQDPALLAKRKVTRP